MSKTKEQIVKELSANIPRDAIEQRDGGGRKLSYLAGWYVINKLNEIFGADGWSYDTTEIRLVHQGVISTRSGDTNSASYTATVALYVQFPGSESAKRITDVGFGNGTDKLDPGKPHELATKEAVTDALKRCAKSLGMSLGLALYDKTQEFVGDPEPVSKAPAPKAEGVKPVKMPTEYPSEQPKAESRPAINAAITANGKLLIAKGQHTAESFKTMRKEKFGVDSTDALTDEQANQLLTQLKKEVADGK